MLSNGGGNDLFKKEFLVSPAQVTGLPDVLRSRSAVLEMGECRSGDVLWCSGHRCGKLNCFYQTGGAILAEVAFFPNVGNNPCLFDAGQEQRTFVDISDIVDALTWFYDRPNIIKVVIPSRVLLEAS